MARFTVGIVQYGINPHVRCFEDFARALGAALRDLGHEADSNYTNPGRIIQFGANNVVDKDNKMPRDTITFNTEQVSAVDNPAAMMSNWQQYRNRVVWDYSKANIDALAKLDIKAVHCPIGYHPSMTKIEPVEEDIDVLFYGSVGVRRKEILDEIADLGLNLRVVMPPGLYGEERDKLIARAKVVLNLHFYERPVFEIFRVSHLLANKKCVVSEGDGFDSALEAFAGRSTALVPRYHVALMCKKLVESEIARREIAEIGFREFSAISLVENVQRALEAS